VSLDSTSVCVVEADGGEVLGLLGIRGGVHPLGG
jgi:hypothetical protein